MWSLEGIPSRKLQVQILPWAAYFVDRKVEERGVRCTPTTPSPAGGWREEVRLVTKLGEHFMSPAVRAWCIGSADLQKKSYCSCKGVR